MLSFEQDKLPSLVNVVVVIVIAISKFVQRGYIFEKDGEPFPRSRSTCNKTCLYDQRPIHIGVVKCVLTFPSKYLTYIDHHKTTILKFALDFMSAFEVWPTLLIHLVKCIENLQSNII